MGDETRLQILELLSPGEQCVADLMAATGLGQSLVSHHLRTLRDAGLVHDRRDGRWIFYSLAEAAIAAVRQTVEDIERIPDGVV
jgi:ArsR family transcriptional regulator